MNKRLFDSPHSGHFTAINFLHFEQKAIQFSVYPPKQERIWALIRESVCQPAISIRGN